jgi:hypothetical protein
MIPLAISVANDDAGPEVRQLQLDSLGIGDPSDDPITDRAVSRGAVEGNGPETEVEVCRSCGLSVWVGARFCRRCGQVLGEPAPVGASRMVAAAEPLVQQPQRAVGGRKRRHADGAPADRSPKGAKGSRPTPGTDR